MSLLADKYTVICAHISGLVDDSPLNHPNNALCTKKHSANKLHAE